MNYFFNGSNVKVFLEMSNLGPLNGQNHLGIALKEARPVITRLLGTSQSHLKSVWRAERRSVPPITILASKEC